MKVKKYLMNLLTQYEALVPKKEKIFLASRKEKPEVGDLRRLETFPPIYLLVVDRVDFYNETLFKCVVLTEEVELGYLGGTPLLLLDELKTLLVTLPLWVYLLEDFLQNYSTKLIYVDEKKRKEALEYALTRKIPLGTVQGEYIELVAKRLAPYNTESLLTFFEALEKEDVQLIELDQNYFKPYEGYQYAFAATSRGVLKGSNWFGIIERLKEQAKLILYLPQEYIGLKVKIKLSNQILFEGILETDKIILENLPLFSDYSFLEEELDVQV